MRVFLFLVLFTAWMTAAEVGHHHHHHSHDHHHHHHEAKVGGVHCQDTNANNFLAGSTGWSDCTYDYVEGYGFCPETCHDFLDDYEDIACLEEVCDQCDVCLKPEGGCEWPWSPWSPLTNDMIPDGTTLFNADDTKYVEVTDSAACEKHCEDNDECDGYSYHLKNDRCWMKTGSSGMTTTTDKNRAGSFRKCEWKPEPKCWWLPTKDDLVANGETMIQPDGGKFKVVTDIDACQAHCEGTSECDGYSYHKNNNRCWLKSGSTAFAATTDKNRRSSYQNCIGCEWTPWATLTDERIPNGEVVEYSDGKKFQVVSNVAACKANCLANPPCDGYVFHTSLNRCWMKSGSTGFETTTYNYRQSSYRSCLFFQGSV